MVVLTGQVDASVLGKSWVWWYGRLVLGKDGIMLQICLIFIVCLCLLSPYINLDVLGSFKGLHNRAYLFLLKTVSKIHYTYKLPQLNIYTIHIHKNLNFEKDQFYKIFHLNIILYI